ncbi:hypothetical protein cyc_07381 [Cyclospora cayetanensis]|uniref:Uncharacterized protein n=1 Tax=Cyclospora cayetanensis TaxID=88456 RepID=A0A1D3CRV7_9EIME|nr:hypothetical protein cyc_07381 [Cyclospora cayetanensis]
MQSSPVAGGHQSQLPPLRRGKGGGPRGPPPASTGGGGKAGKDSWKRGYGGGSSSLCTPRCWSQKVGAPFLQDGGPSPEKGLLGTERSARQPRGAPQHRGGRGTNGGNTGEGGFSRKGPLSKENERPVPPQPSAESPREALVRGCSDTAEGSVHAGRKQSTIRPNSCAEKLRLLFCGVKKYSRASAERTVTLTCPPSACPRPPPLEGAPLAPLRCARQCRESLLPVLSQGLCMQQRGSMQYQKGSAATAKRKRESCSIQG